MATAGKLQVEIGANTTPLATGLQKAAGELRSFLTLGALASAASQAIAYGSAINDAAVKSGVGVKWLQATAYAAKLAGSSLEELSTALIELRRAQAQAMGGSATDAAAFARLGIPRGLIGQLGPEELFDRVASAVQQSQGGLEEVNAALQVLGRGGKGMLAGLVDGFSEARAEAYRLGLVLEDSTIKAMDQLGDRLDTVNLKLKAITATILRLMFDSKTSQAWMEIFKIISPAETLSAMWNGRGDRLAQSVIENNLKAVTNIRQLLEDYEAEEAAAGSGGAKAAPGTGLDLGKGKRQRSAVSDLARIGGYMAGGGVGGNPLLRVQNQALVELRQMRATLARIANRQPGESITW